MELNTVSQWDEEIWKKVEPIYLSAFSDKGGKSPAIVQNMFKKGICFLHIAFENGEVLGMAITGQLEGTCSLVIDYVAIDERFRNKGKGQRFVEKICYWAKQERMVDRVLIEVESENISENLKRIDFWKKCGFILTDYVHTYIWVPETYQAMYFPLKTNHVEMKGEEIFQLIGEFHRKSFSKK